MALCVQCAVELAALRGAAEWNARVVVSTVVRQNGGGLRVLCGTADRIAAVDGRAEPLTLV